ETWLLKSWPKDGPAKLWTAKDLGTSFGAPAVACGKIFGMGTRDGRDGMWALNEADGKELWFTAIGNTGARDRNSGPGSTPAYAEGKVYGVTSAGEVACLDPATGKMIWHKSYKSPEFGGASPGWGSRSEEHTSELQSRGHLVCRL